MGVPRAPLQELPLLSLLLWCLTPERGRVELAAEAHLPSLPSRTQRVILGVPGALLPPKGSAPLRQEGGGTLSPESPNEGGRGGQSLPELGRGSLPEENQLSLQLSQLEYWRAVAAKVLQEPGRASPTPPGSLTTETHGSMLPPEYQGAGAEGIPRPVLLGDRSKATSFSWKEMEDSDRLSGEVVLLWVQVVWCTITIALSISLPGLRDLLLLLLLLATLLQVACPLRPSSPPPGRLLPFLRTVPWPRSSPLSPSSHCSWVERGVCWLPVWHWATRSSQPPQPPPHPGSLLGRGRGKGGGAAEPGT